MQIWDERSDKVTKIRPDPEKARALFRMTELIEHRIRVTPRPEFTTLLVEDYYEVIKELITAIMSADGWKTTSHELLVGYLDHFYPTVEASKIALIDQLRTMRNDIDYRGVIIPEEFLTRNEPSITKAIIELKEILKRRFSP